MKTRPTFNVASHSYIDGSVDRLYERFHRAGFREEDWPDDHGNIPVDVFPNQHVGRTRIRDVLSEDVARLTGRITPYTRQHQNQLMREGGVLAACEEVAEGIPAIRVNSLHSIAEQLACRPRREGRGRRLQPRIVELGPLSRKSK